MPIFPAGLDNITEGITPTTPQSGVHSSLHNQLADVVNAIEVELLPGGTLSMADHVADSNPHPGYLTQAEGDALYAPIGGGGGLTLPLGEHLTFSPDSTFDIGASGASRPRSIYLGNTLVVGGPTQTLGNVGDIAFARGDGTAAIFFGGPSAAYSYLLFSNPVYKFVSQSGIASLDFGVLRPTDNVVEQRNGTSAQTLRIYNTYTDSGNWEALTIQAFADAFYISSQKTGSGVNRDLYVRAANSLYLGTTLVGGTGVQWQISTLGHFQALNDSLQDIGQAASNRPRNVFAAGAIATGVKAGPATDSDVDTPTSGMIRVDSTNNRLYVRVGSTWRYAALT